MIFVCQVVVIKKAADYLIHAIIFSGVCEKHITAANSCRTDGLWQLLFDTFGSQRQTQHVPEDVSGH